MTWFAIMGYIATVLGIISFAPQTIKTMKEKKKGTLSTFTFISLFFGCPFWTLYGGLIKNTINSDGVLTSYSDALPAWITNIIIFFLMIPIVWYVLNNKKQFVLVVLSAGVVITIATLFMFTGIIKSVPVALEYVFVIVAGSLTGFPYIPQTLRVMKDKKIGDVSFAMISIIIASNTFWVSYWIGMVISSPLNGTIYLSILFTFIGVVTNLPTMIIFLQNRKRDLKLIK